MKASKKIVLAMLIVLIALAFVPPWGRPFLPCGRTLWRYASYPAAYAPAGPRLAVPDYAFPGFPPRCLDVERMRGYAI